MRRALITIGIAVGLVGVIATLFPLLSTWNGGGQALATLPALDTRGYDVRHSLPIFDPDFVVAERIYYDISAVGIERALRNRGFEQIDGAWSKECCGGYGAVWVTVEPHGDDGSRAILTLADSDIQSTWPYISLPGLVVATFGFVLALQAWDVRWRRILWDWLSYPKSKYGKQSGEVIRRRAHRRTPPGW